MPTKSTGRPRGRPPGYHTPWASSKKFAHLQTWPHARWMVWSGGQTGVDRAALDAADLLGIPLGGYCPKGRKAEDGPLDPKYPLKELGYGYKYRTMMNVLRSHGTLIVWPNGKGSEQKSRGTALTVGFCIDYNKPYLQMDLGERDPVLVARRTQATADWILQDIIPLGGRLNVAGPRESELGGQYRATYDFLVEVFKLVKERMEA